MLRSKTFNNHSLPGISVRGFTLLEVMAALSIIAIALTVLLTSQSQSMSMASEARFHTRASLLAQMKIAEISTAKTEDLQSESGDFGEEFPDYYWEIESDTEPSSVQEEIAEYLRQIDLTIYFGENRQYQYNTRFYQFVAGE